MKQNLMNLKLRNAFMLILIALVPGLNCLALSRDFSKQVEPVRFQRASEENGGNGKVTLDPNKTLNYSNLNFKGDTLPLRVGNGDANAWIEGKVEIYDDGTGNGSLTVSLAEDGTANTDIMFEGTEVYLISDGQVIDILPNDPEYILIDGKDTYIPNLMDQIFDEWNTKSPTGWSPEARSLAAFIQVAMTPAWQVNSGLAQVAFFSAGFWCKAACLLVGGLVTAILTAGCAAILAGCAAATTITIGGVAVPCAWAIGICAGGVFVGAGAAYELWLSEVWG